MSATIEINGIRATIQGGRWVTPAPDLLRKLEALDCPSYLPDGVNAREAIAQLGGTLISESPEPGELDADQLPIH